MNIQRLRSLEYEGTVHQTYPFYIKRGPTRPKTKCTGEKVILGLVQTRES